VAGSGMEEGRGGWLGELPGLSSRYSFFFIAFFLLWTLDLIPCYWLPIPTFVQGISKERMNQT
jgi:hypothetical protein